MSHTLIESHIAIIGGGPAGMCAAVAAASQGARVLLLERSENLGGQLIKQTHMFFGSQKQRASVRGIDIAGILNGEINESDKITVMTNTTVLGLYEDGILTAEQNGKYIKIKPRSIIAATGASEKFLSFPNNDLPGVYGAGAVQTLMNVHGVLPGKSAVMVGAGNIGLIVGYQLAQAGVRVKAVIEASPRIGGFLVHASKLRRMGVPIYTSHSVLKAHGTETLERITAARLDENWKSIAGTEFDIDTDTLCISVGLSPLTELLWQAGCKMAFIPELGGHVPLRDADLRTSKPNIYVAGDAAGVEEASSAMVEGRLAGLNAARDLGCLTLNNTELKLDCLAQLDDLRRGPVGERIRAGIKKAETEAVL